MSQPHKRSPSDTLLAADLKRRSGSVDLSLVPRPSRGFTPRRTAALVLLLALVFRFAFYLHARLTVLGLYRSNIPGIETYVAEHDRFTLSGLKQAEDMAYVEELGKIYAVGQGNTSTRFRWFPPSGVMDHPEESGLGDGGLYAVDVQVRAVPRI